MGPRRRRTLAAVAAAFAVLAVVGWWVAREDGPGPTAPPASVPEATAPAAREPLAEPAPPPAETTAVTSVVRILDARSGVPVENAVLSVGPLLARGPLATAEPGPGLLEIEGPPGTVVRLVADAGGFVPAERSFTLDRWPRLDLHLCPVETLQVRVVREEDGQPLPGAWVDVEGDPILHRGENRVRTWRGRTDSEGWVSCPEGGPGRNLTVTVQSEERGPAVRSGEAPPEGVVVTAGPGARAEVRVLDRGGTPVEGARLLPLRLDGSPEIQERLAPTTDREGLGTVVSSATRKTADGLPILVTAPGKSPAIVRAETGTTTVRLQEAIPAGVRVLDGAGAPVSGLPVRIVPLHGPGRRTDAALPGVLVETRADGRAVVPAVESATEYLVTVGAASDLLLASGSFRGDRLRSFPSISVPSPVERRVLVLAPDGGPAPGARLLLAGPGALDGPSTPWDPVHAGESALHAGPDGSASVLTGEGSVEAIVATAGPFLAGSAPPEAGGAPTTVRLRASAILKVAVTDRAGEPVPAVTVLVRPQPDGTIPPGVLSGAVQRGWTGPQGTAAFEVPGGVPLLVQAASAGSLNREAATVTVPGGGSTSVSFTLGGPRRVWVVVTDAKGTRAPGAEVRVFVQGLDSPWLARGVADERGILGLSLPPLDYRAPGDGGEPVVWFRITGPVDGAAEYRNSEVVDNLHVAAGGRLPGTWIRLIESPLFPDGTPFRFEVRGAPDGRTLVTGGGRVGEEVPFHSPKHPAQVLVIRLPGTAPLAWPLRDLYKLNKAEWLRDEENRLKEEIRAAERGGHSERVRLLRELWKSLLFSDRMERESFGLSAIRLPYAATLLRNRTGARARLHLVLPDDGSSLWISPMTSPDRTVPVSVILTGGMRAEWVPAE